MESKGNRIKREWIPGLPAVFADEKTASPARRLIPAAIFVLTVAAFLPALQNSFVDWDDYKTLLENPRYRGLGRPELQWMFTTFHMGHYQPLSWLSFAFDYLVWGLEPFGYHLTNLLLHAANAVVFYCVALRLLSLALSGPASLPGSSLRAAAGVAALLFAVHPLRVESVAWATERRDVLSGLFFLLTILCYLRARMEAAGSSEPRLRAALVFYLLSLLAKASGVTLPVVLVALDVYPLKRLGGGAGRWLDRAARRVWLEKLPFVFLAALFGVVAFMAQREAGALTSVEGHGLASRLAQAVFGLGFYLWKSAIPAGLSPLYELPGRLSPWDWPVLLSGAVVSAISVGLCLIRRRWPAALASWVYYVAVLAPVLGIAQSGPQLVADRYSYLSCLSWAVLAGAGLIYCGRRVSYRRPAYGLAALLLVVLATLTWKQTKVWRDTERLWRHALNVTQTSSTAYYNLGYVLYKRGELDEAMALYRRSLELNPSAPDAYYYLANALAGRGRLEEAMERYREALRLKPDFWGAHHNLAIVLERRKRVEEAIEHYFQAAKLNPDSAEVRFDLGRALAARGRLEEAIEQLQAVVRIDRSHAQAHFILGSMLALSGRLDEAVGHLEQSLKIRPRFAQAHHAVGRILAARGDLKGAIERFQEAVRFEPAYADAHENLARALALLGRNDEAVGHSRTAASIRRSAPPSPELRRAEK